MPENVRWKTDDNSVTLWWDPPSTANEILVRGYTISYGIGTPSRRVIIEGANTNAFTINRLRPNTTYVFALTAYNEADGEDSEKVLFTATTEIGKSSEEHSIYLQPPANIKASATSSHEIELNWNDPNLNSYLYEHFPDSIKTSLKKRKYIIQYGEYQSLNLEKITSAVPHVRLSNLKPSTDYEITVKVILPNGMESAWSIREIIRTESSNAIPSKESGMLELRFDFEQAEKSFFYSDPSAPLQWKMIDVGEQLSDGTSGYSIGLQSTTMDESYGRLISTSFSLTDDNYCISIWIYAKDFSKGTLTVALLENVENGNHKINLITEELERLGKQRWNHLFANFINSRNPFQVLLEVRKQESDQFWIALNDITVLSGKCFDGDPDTILPDDDRIEC
uniref:Fibronectin type-III domain-containing protein n=1 Tax=Setaria digitata TaxID=48799 RepID=A0A915PQ82_9BILA